MLLRSALTKTLLTGHLAGNLVKINCILSTFCEVYLSTTQEFSINLVIKMYHLGLYCKGQDSNLDATTNIHFIIIYIYIYYIYICI